MSAEERVLFVAEPRAVYMSRPSVVTDCSVIAGFVFREPSMALANAKMDGRDLKAPYLLTSEIISVAVKKHRQGFAELAEQGLGVFQSLSIELAAVNPLQVLALALRYKLTAYDASYLWLAAELKAPLATFDEQLGRAAQTHLASLP
jgi:predicted nucleic acid-binding protein